MRTWAVGLLSLALLAAAPEAPARAPRGGGLADFLRARVPEGARVVAPGAGVRVIHTVQPGETARSIASAYLGLSEVYFLDDFEKHIAKAMAGRARFEVPDLVDAPFRTGDAARLGWPKDGRVEAVYVRDDTHGRFFAALDRMPPRGMNAIVVDGKDYDGLFTYPTRIPLARETGAAAHAPVRDLARLVRFAHARGVRAILRVACFHDPHTAERAPRLSIRGKGGGPYPIGWLDPANDEAQRYVLDAVDEGLDAGFDEINLDYIRYPVQPHLGNAALPPPGIARQTVIRDFVRRVHAHTRARGAMLSLDVFGVAAFGSHPDVDNLGQDVAMLAPECEAIAPMVYPSHYDAGFHGWAQPGDHPEIIGIGTRAAIELVAAAPGRRAVIRPWLQAFDLRSPSFGPRYVSEEVRHAREAGAHGFMLWNPNMEYATSFRGLPARGAPRATARR